MKPTDPLTDDKYILDGHTPVPAKGLLTWAKWFETADRHVAVTKFGKVTVSTVFLGLDHSFAVYTGVPHKPILFETMIFGGKHDQYQERYTTWKEAEAGHKRAVKLVEPMKGKNARTKK